MARSWLPRAHGPRAMHGRLAQRPPRRGGRPRLRQRRHSEQRWVGAERPSSRARGSSARTLELDAHLLRELAAEGVLLAADADEERAAEGLCTGHLEASARANPPLREIAEHLGIRIG